jgi:predicted ATPase
MRIAISGSHATGKSTLVAELARRVAGLTVIDEPYYLLEEEGHAFATPPITEDFVALAERSIVLLTREHPGPVVFDRSPADYLAYLTARRDAESARDLTIAVDTALKTLDLVIFVPIEHPDRITGAEAPRLRRRVDEVLRAMLVDDAWAFDVPVLEVRGTVVDRAAQVEARVTPLLRSAPVTYGRMRRQPDERGD